MLEKRAWAMKRLDHRRRRCPRPPGTPTVRRASDRACLARFHAGVMFMQTRDGHDVRHGIIAVTTRRSNAADLLASRSPRAFGVESSGLRERMAKRRRCRVVRHARRSGAGAPHSRITATRSAWIGLASVRFVVCSSRR